MDVLGLDLLREMYGWLSVESAIRIRSIDRKTLEERLPRYASVLLGFIHDGTPKPLPYMARPEEYPLSISLLYSHLPYRCVPIFMSAMLTGTASELMQVVQFGMGEIRSKLWEDPSRVPEWDRKVVVAALWDDGPHNTLYEMARARSLISVMHTLADNRLMLLGDIDMERALERGDIARAEYLRTRGVVVHGYLASCFDDESVKRWVRRWAAPRAQ